MSVCVMQRVFSRWRIPAGTVPQGLVAARLLLVEEVHGPFYTDRGERKNGVAEDLEPFGQRFAFLGRPFAQHLIKHNGRKTMENIEKTEAFIFCLKDFKNIQIQFSS